MVSVQQLEYLNMYQISMEDLETGQTHQVSLLNFTAWPEQGSPDTGIPLLQVGTVSHIYRWTNTNTVKPARREYPLMVPKTGFIVLLTKVIFEHVKSNIYSKKVVFYHKSVAGRGL